METSREPTVICKPALDHREYCHLRLGPRGELMAVLISDPETEKAAAAMDVGVGHSSDPASLPGLAHFCEHMLFLGTDKYPEEGSYQAFVCEHGGACNAFTGYENTNFHFDVSPAALPDALDRFAQFFVAPRFTESATRRELHAVDAEHAKNAQGDPWRLMQLLKSFAAPGHPFAKFGTGNLATLRDGAAGGGTEGGADGVGTATEGGGQVDLREALRAFHASHYHASAMRLVVLGRESLDELQAMCARLFGDIPLHPPTVPPSDAASMVAAAAGPSAAHGSPYGPAELRRGVQAVPVGEQRTLTLTWPLPPLRPFWRSKPHRLVGHLLGHEGPGSLLSLLKAKGWADGLCAGEGNHAYAGFGLFEVSIELTEEGDNAEVVEEVAALVFQYVRMLEAAPEERWRAVFDECAALGELSFRFRDDAPPCETASTLAQCLGWYPAEAVLSGSYLFDEFAPEQIAEILRCLSPHGAVMTHVSRRHAATATEREAWYGTAYAAAQLRAELLERWAAAPPHAALQLPPPNPFIPTDFALVAEREPGAAAASAARARTASAPAARAADANGAADAPGASRAAEDPFAHLSASAAAAARAAAAAWSAPLRKLRGLAGENVRHTDAGSTGVLDALQFATFGAPEALCSRGVAYYEITLLAAAKKGTNDVQAGFASAEFRVLGDAAGHSPDGVGDDAESWAVDGVRKLKWHKGQARWACKPWAAGDVIGLAAHVGLGKLAVSRNGDWSERGCGVVFSDRAIRSGVYPALSLQRHPVRYAFAADGFRHAPPPAEVWEEAKQGGGKAARGKKGHACGGSGGAAGAEEEAGGGGCGALEDGGGEEGGEAAREGGAAPPVPIVDDGALRLWHKLDRSFHRPKAHFRLDLVTPAAYHSPGAAVLAHLFARLVSDELNEYSYHAQVAGLDYLVSNTSSGLSVRVEGYSHRLPLLLTKVVARLAEAHLCPERFAVQLDLVRRGYVNFFSDDPIRHAAYNVTHLLELPRWHVSEYLAFASNAAACSHAALVAFARPGGPLLAQTFAEALWHGNTSAADAADATRAALAALHGAPLPPSQRPAPRLLQLPVGVEVVLRQHASLLGPESARHTNLHETNSAVEVYLQIGPDARPGSLLLELLSRCLEQAVYQQLRTEEQLGYLVHSGVRFDHGVVGLRLLVQSSEHDAAYLEARVGAFLRRVPALLGAMSATDFRAHRQALIAQKLERDRSLAEESARHWAPITLGTRDFERARQDAAALRSLTQPQLRAFWAEYCAHGAPRRRYLASLVFAPRHALPPPPAGTHVCCADGLAAALALKNTLHAYPCPGPSE